MLHLDHARIKELLFNNIDERGARAYRIELDPTKAEQQSNMLFQRIAKSFANQQLLQVQAERTTAQGLGPLMGDAMQQASLSALQAEDSLELMDSELKPGEDKGLLFMFLEDVVWEDEMMRGIVLFTLQDKDLVLQLDAQEYLHFIQGLVLGKSPLSMLFLQSEGSARTKVVLNASKRDAEKLMQRFDLELVPNSFYKTSEMIQLTNAFVKHKFEDEALDKLEETEVRYRSKEYFDNVEQFDQSNYSSEVFQDTQLSQEFEQFVDAQVQSLPAANSMHSFAISDQAVNKQKSVFKSVIKLDKNFHIYVHGDRSKIQKGVDDDGRKFYQVYYEEEH